MRIMVTGATGFVGSHVVRELAGAGHEIVGVDIHEPDDAVRHYLRDVTARVRFVQADISTPGAVPGAVNAALDATVHMAVITSTPEFELAHPDRVVDVNVVGTVEVLRASRRLGAGRFIYVSSSGVYGDTDPEVVLSETHPLQLGTLYTMTKFASERLVAAERASGGLMAASVRIAAPYGPMERPTGARTLMSPLYALVRAARDRRAISIAHPNAGRDWTHASDIGLGIRTLLEAPAWDHECYNLSSGHRVSFGEVADILTALAPGFTWRRMSDGPVDIDGAQAHRRGPLDISRLRRLGFAPRYAIREGLQDTLHWLRETRLP